MLNLLAKLSGSSASSSPAPVYLDDTKQSWVMEGRLPPHLRRDPAEFKRLWALHPPEKGKWKFMGEVRDVPRFHQSYNLPYFFGGMNHVALPVPDELAGLWAWANGLGYGPFNEILVNWYPDGNSYIGKHSDPQDEKGTPILSVSYGQIRTFRVRERKTGKIVREFLCHDSSWLIMGGRMQQEYHHEVPKVNGKKGAAMGPRINITFRQFKDDSRKVEVEKDPMVPSSAVSGPSAAASAMSTKEVKEQKIKAEQETPKVREKRPATEVTLEEQEAEENPTTKRRRAEE